MLSTAYPKIKGLELFLKQAQKDTNPHSKGVRGGLAAGLAKSVCTRFQDILQMEDKHIGPATLLDPHYKDSMFSSFELKEKAKEELVKMIVDENPSAETEHEIPVNYESNKEENTDYFDLESLTQKECGEDEGQTVQKTNTNDIRSKAITEIDQLTREPILPRLKVDQTKEQTIETLTWWRANKHRFLLLTPIAAKLFGIATSSADSERLFSCEGLIVSEKRNRLTADNAERLLFISQNLGVSN